MSEGRAVDLFFRHSIIDVNHRQNAGLQRDSFSLQPPGIAFPIPTFVTGENILADCGQFGRVPGDTVPARICQNENVLAFLSRKNVPLKYGFPVDTVEMQVGDYQEGGKLGVQL